MTKEQRSRQISNRLLTGIAAVTSLIMVYHLLMLMMTDGQGPIKETVGTETHYITSSSSIQNGVPVENETVTICRITAYCPCEQCCGIYADGITYSGTEATEGRTVAADINIYPIGTTLLIGGEEYTVEDIGGAVQGMTIDVYFSSHEDALKYGVKYETVEIIEQEN